MTKRTRIALMAAAVLAVAAPAATAGTYTIHSCQTPSGTFVGDEGWVSLAGAPQPNRDGGLIETCTANGRPLGIRFGDEQLPAEPGAGRTWRFSAAQNTKIASATITRRFELTWHVEDGLYGRGYVADIWHDNDEVSNRIEFRMAPWGGSTDSARAGAHASRTGGAWDSVSMRLRCWESQGDHLCAAARTALQMTAATFVLSDTHAPAGTADVGALAGAVRGTAPVGVSASDVGGGVYRAIVSVDGHETARQVLDDDGGRCGDVEAGNGDAYEFAAPRPCPLSAAGTVALDTRGLLDGQHQLRVEVEDAAGNVTLLHDGTFTTRNGPIATAAPHISGGDGVKVGDVLGGVDGAWDGSPSQVTLRWLRCGADGSACAPVAGAIGGVYAVTPADAGRRLVLEALASNANGDGSARSQPTTVVAAPTGGGDADPPDGPAGPSGPAGPTGPTGPTGPGGSTPPPGGVDGLHNPVADQGGSTPNGDGASGRARLTLRLRLAGGGSANRVRGPRSRRWTATGRLVDPQGRAIADARVNVVARVGSGRWKAAGVVRTGRDGRFSRTFAAGPNRQIRATYFPFADSRTFRSSNVVAIEALTPLTIRADRGRVPGGGTVALTGRVGGRPIPRGGLLVTLQGHQAGWGWRTFATVRTNAAGVWRTRYRFRSRAGRFAFRAVVPRQAGYPYAASTSAAATVRVG